MTKLKVAISQPMYFPWPGLLEQVWLSDIFVHYEDVQFTRGFFNRVQIKTKDGINWLTVPLRSQKRGQNIDEVLIDESTDWRSRHRDILRQAYLKAPFRDEMLGLVDRVFSKEILTLADVSKESINELVGYFGIAENAKFVSSKGMRTSKASSTRLRDICFDLSANLYLTGHGARNYLDHDLFEQSGIRVEYMKYSMSSYPQLHGNFTPFVSALDLLANCGRAGVQILHPKSIYWKEFLNESH